MKILICGGGNMGEALACSLLQKKIFSPDEVFILERREERRDQLAEILECKIISNLSNVVADVNVVVLAIKPQDVDLLFVDLSSFIGKDVLLISIMAGVSLDRLGQLAPVHTSIIRAMPNLPFQVGLGMSVFCASKDVGVQEFMLAEKILGAGGKVLRVESEDLVDAATAISGSGPGYFFSFLEQLEVVANDLGFNSTQSRILIRQTCLGALDYWDKTGCPLNRLKEMVASKGGTTEAAFSVLEQGGWSDLLRAAIVKAYERSQELSR